MAESQQSHDIVKKNLNEIDGPVTTNFAELVIYIQERKWTPQGGMPMSLHMNYHQIDRSHALEQFIADKLEGMKKYLGDGSRVNWIFSRDGDLFESHVLIHSRGKDNFVESVGRDAYESVMLAFRKIKSIGLKDASKVKRSVGGKRKRDMKAALLAG